MNLYQVPAAYAAWAHAVEEAGGEVTPELAEDLLRIEGTLLDRAEAVAALVRNAEAAEGLYRREAADFQRKAAAAKGRARALRTLLIQAMKSLGVDRVAAGRWTASIRRCGTPSIAWKGPGEVPAWCRRVAIELDGPRALKAYKEGADMAGFAVEYSEFVHID